MASKCIHEKNNSVKKAFSTQSTRCVSSITKSFLKFSNLFINLYLAYEYFLQIKWYASSHMSLRNKMENQQYCIIQLCVDHEYFLLIYQ